MKLSHIFKVILLLLLPFFVLAQYPNNPVKSRLGYQTTGDGLVYRGSGAPAYSPGTLFNAWMYLDTVAMALYGYQNFQWVRVPNVNNGLSISSDGYRFQLGGSLVKNTTVETGTYDMKFGRTTGTDYAWMNVYGSGLYSGLFNNYGTDGLEAEITVGAGTANMLVENISIGGNSSFFVTKDGFQSQYLHPSLGVSYWKMDSTKFRLRGLQSYASHAAADLDNTEYQLYRINNSRAIYLKNSAVTSQDILGTGTADRLARWTATNTLGPSNLSDNGTKLQALLPWQFQTYTTAGLPTGVTGYHVYNTTTNGPAWYQGSRWAYGLESTFNRGTATRIPFFDANGQVTEDANVTFNSTNKTLQVGTNSTTLTALDVVARGGVDGLRLYSLNNPNGGSVNPPSIGFYRTTSFVAGNPRFRIYGTNVSSSGSLSDFDGFAFTSPGTPVNWLFGSTNGTSLTSNLLSIGGESANIAGFGVDVYVPKLISGYDRGASTAPVDGYVRSGQKNNTGVNNIPGSNLYIQAGRGTGSGLSTGTLKGDIIFQTPDQNNTVGQEGTLQLQTTKMTLKGVGNLLLGKNVYNAINAILNIDDTSKVVLFPRMTTTQRNNIGVSNAIRTFSFGGSSGSGYTNGSYVNIPLTNISGTGTGATVNLTVSGGTIQFSSIVLVNGGSGYNVSDQVTVTGASLGGGGSGLVLNISEVFTYRGAFIFNTTTGAIEYYDGTNWQSFVTDGFYSTDGSLTSNRTVTGGSFWLNLNSDVGIKQATPLQELDVNGDAYIRDSTRLTTTPAHSAITGLLTRDATGWVGLASLSGLSYSGGVLTGQNIGNTDLTVPSGTDRIFTLAAGGTVTYYNDPSYLGIENSFSNSSSAAHAGFTEVFDKVSSVTSTNTVTTGGVSTQVSKIEKVEKSTTKNVADNRNRIAYADRKGAMYGALIDSVNKAQYVGVFADFDSLASSNVSKISAFSGFAQGKADYLNVRVRTLLKSWVVQSSVRPSASSVLPFNWLEVRNPFSDTTSSSFWLYEKYNFSNSTPGTGSNVHVWDNGTPSFKEIKRDTTIFVTADTDYDFSAAVTTAQIANRYNRIIIHMTLTSGVGADKTTTLHTPDANLMQCEILIRGTDNTGSFDNEIAFGTNNAISSDGTNVSGYTLAQGQGLHVRVVYNGSAYKYIYY